MSDRADIVIVGAGAAGLMTAIWAARTDANRLIVVLDGARTLGAKILVAGGGRCNVTHHAVDERAFAGSTPPAIGKVLRRFDVPHTIGFFRELGVELKREETGKLFPTTDDARTVLNALLGECRRTGVRVQHPRRVESIGSDDEGFVVRGDWGSARARSLVIATGGKSLPKSGSDGAGYAFAKTFGHTVTDRVFPALVPLILDPACFLRSLSGVSFEATLEVRSSAGGRIASFTNSALATHFGLSGPATLDISRHLTAARLDDPAARLVINFLPGESANSLDRALLDAGGTSVTRFLSSRVPERVARGLAMEAGVDPASRISNLSREGRKRLVAAATMYDAPVTGDRGFTHAEVTAGGVPLSEIHLKTMESRITPGLHLVGEICDVDGRIGGFNFQWAWSSGYSAGVSVGLAARTAPNSTRGLTEERPTVGCSPPRGPVAQRPRAADS